MNDGLLGFPRGESPSLLGYPLGTPLPDVPPVASPALWLDARDLNSLVVASDLLGTWKDKSGNSFHGVQATDARKPGYGAARLRRIGGIVVPDFDGGDWLDTGWVDTTKPWAGFYVFDPDSLGDGGSNGKTLSNHITAERFVSVNLTMSFYIGNFVNWSGGLPAIGRPNVWGITWDGTNYRLGYNNARQTGTQTGNDPAGTFRLGSRSGPGQDFDGGIGLCVTYDRYLDPTEFDAMMGWCQAGWGG